MTLMFIQPFLVGVILAFAWGIVKGIIKGESLSGKGIYFGSVYWVTTIPGMVMPYSSFPVSFILVCSWSITLLFQTLCARLLFSKMLK